MSLINNMLRDLEAQKKVNQKRPLQESELTPMNHSGTRRRTLIVCSAIIVLVGVIGLWLKWNLFVSDQPVPQIVQETIGSRSSTHVPASFDVVRPLILPQATESLPVQAKNSAAEKNSDLRLSALTVLEEVTRARIKLEFERMPDYRLIQNGTGTEPLIVSFNAVRLDPDFELPELQGQIIDNVSLRPQKDTLQLLIYSKNQTQVRGLQIEGSQDHGFEFWVELDAVNSQNEPVVAGVAPIPDVDVRPEQNNTAGSVSEVEVEKVNKKLESVAPEKRAFVVAMQALQQQDLIQAQRSFERALQFNPHMIVARTQLVDLLVLIRDFAAAEEYLRQGVQLAPANMTVRKQLARLLLQQQQSDEALVLLQRNPLPTVAEDLEYHALYAAALQEQRHFEESGQLYRQLVNQRPQQAVWWMGLAISMDQAGLNEQARGAYEQAVALPGLRPDLQDYIQGRLQAL